jgi:hypothetical protein
MNLYTVFFYCSTHLRLRSLLNQLRASLVMSWIRSRAAFDRVGFGLRRYPDQSLLSQETKNLLSLSSIFYSVFLIFTLFFSFIIWLGKDGSPLLIISKPLD